MADLKPKLAERDILPSGPSSAGLGVVGMIALVIAALYVGREVFVPVALAILLATVTTLERVDTRTASNEAPPGTTGLARPHPPLDRAPGQPLGH